MLNETKERAEKEMIESKTKRHIVYPHGASTLEELNKWGELLALKLTNPKTIKHNGFWNLEADTTEANK